MQLLITILLIDDDEQLRAALADYLQLSHPQLQVQEADSGCNALLRLAVQPPDLIITDLHMPDFTGYELALTLRARPETHSIPIVVLTGAGPNDPEVLRVRPFCQQILFKPLPFVELNKIISAMIQSKLSSRLESVGAAEELEQSVLMHQTG